MLSPCDGYTTDLCVLHLVLIFYLLDMLLELVFFYLCQCLHRQQVGLAEMKVAIERTGGLVVLSESFGHSVFKDSFKRIFEGGEQSLGLSFKYVFCPSLAFSFLFTHP